MKQIGLAVHNYLDTYRVFPTFLSVEDDFSYVGSWQTRILPFMDQSAVYDKLNFNSGPDECSDNYMVAANRTAVAAKMGCYVCPSDPNSSNSWDYSAGIGNSGIAKGATNGVTNYGGQMWAGRIWGAGGTQEYKSPIFSAWLSRDIRNNGSVGLTDDSITQNVPPKSPKTVSDGLAKTSYAMELRCKVPGSAGAPATDPIGYTIFTWFLAQNPVWIVYQDCNYSDTVSPWFSGPIVAPRFGINLPLDPTKLPTGLASTGPIYLAAGSYHPGGCNVLLADGSTQFVSQNADFSVLRALTTASWNETNGVPF